MDVIEIEAKERQPGKKHARAARRAEEVPCVLYGRHVDAVPFQVPELSLRPLIYTSETHRVLIKVNGNEWECILKDVVMHPVTDRPRHADFQVLQQGEKITLTVPIQYHGIPVGQSEGGDTQVIMNEIEVSCLPKDIPSHIDLDISALAIGDALHVSDIESEGLEFGSAPTQTLVTVVPPRTEEELEALEAEAGIVREESEAEILEEGEVADEAEAESDDEDAEEQA